MTALTAFERLEAPGTWRPGPAAQAREVVVSLGEATLILSDPRSERPLAHWSLPGVVRIAAEPGGGVAYAPGGAEGDERVVIHDALMNEAIARVHGAILRRRGRPARLRRGAGALGLAVVTALAVAFGPNALTRHAARILSPAVAERVGAETVAALERQTGRACAGQPGAAVLDRWSARALGPGTRVHILPAALPGGALALAGGHVATGPDALAAAGGPEALATALALARTRRPEAAAREAALADAGMRATWRLLTAGALRPGSLDGHATRLLDSGSAAAVAADPGVGTRAGGDPGRSAPGTGAAPTAASAPGPPADARGGRPAIMPPNASLEDGAWLALQQICAPA